MVTTENVLPSKNERPTRLLPWGIALIAVGVMAVCLITGVGGFIFIFSKIAQEKPPVETALDSFMKFMAAKETDKAYDLFSPRSRRLTPKSQLKRMTEGTNFALFDGYQSLSAQEFKVSVAANPDPDAPQGTVATVKGIIAYDNRFQGSFDATLEKVDDQWKVYYIFITIPPDKFQP